MRREALVAGSVAAATLLAACGDDGGRDAVEVTGAWALPTAPGADTAAFYMAIGNSSDVADRLIDAESSACAATTLHLAEITDGVMTMTPAGPDDLMVPIDGTLTLEPGGLHVMCVGLTDPLTEGQEVEVGLILERAGRTETIVVVSGPS